MTLNVIQDYVHVPTDTGYATSR